MAFKYGMSEKELEFFSENGYIGPFPSPFSKAEIDEVLRAASAPLPEFMTCMKEGTNPTSPVYDWSKIDMTVNPGLTDEFRRRLLVSNMLSRDLHLSNPKMLDFLSHPFVTDKIASILGSDLLLWRSQIFAAAPKNPAQKFTEDKYFIRWHQGANFCGLSGRPSIVPSGSMTVWMALTPVDADRAPFCVLPRTHRLGPVPLENDGHKGRFGDALKWNLDYSKEVSFNCQPGDFIIFDEYLVHGSHANKTNETRVSLTGRYVPVTTYVNKETWSYDPTICADAPNPHAQGLDLPRLKYPVRDLQYDNFGMPLDKWGCVLVRGKDPYGLNKMVSPTK